MNAKRCVILITTSVRRSHATLLACCVGAGLPAAAQTSVVLYGSLDAGVSQVNSGAPGAASLRQLHSGAMRASLWGLRGSEDLGSGLRATFVLEAGLDLDTGNAEFFASNPSLATPARPRLPASAGARWLASRAAWAA